MRGEVDRLLRLAGTQHEFARLLESRIARVRSDLADLEQKRLEMMLAVERASTAGLVVYAAAMRRLAEIDNARIALEQRVSEMNGKMLKAKGAQEVFARRADTLEKVQERKVIEEESREVALAMKATGKHGVVK